MQDVSRSEFDLIYAEALDRISRDQEDAAGFFKRMRFADVRMMTLAEGEISELHVGLKGTMNALFLKDLAQKTRRGLQGRVLQGLSGGSLCYGYDLLLGETGVRRINKSEGDWSLQQHSTAVSHDGPFPPAHRASIPPGPTTRSQVCGQLVGASPAGPIRQKEARL